MVVSAQDPYVIDSITKALPKLDDSKKEPYYSELAWQYVFVDYNKAFEFGTKALKYAEKSKDSIQMSDAYNVLGAIYIKKSNYDSAIYFNEKALKIRIALHDIRGMGGSYSKLGMILTDQGYFDKALEYQLKALDNFLESEDLAAEAQTYNNICQIYNYLENFDMAIFYANKCIKMYEEIDYPYGEATAISNLAIYYENKNELDSAIYYTVKGKEIFEQLNYTADIANSENTLGLYYRNLGNNIQGLYHYNRAYKLAKQLNDDFSMAQFDANRGATYLDLNKLDSALISYTNALNLAKKHGLLRVQRQSFEGLANYYEKKGNFKLSLENRKMFEIFNDSILDSELQEAMALADAKFQNTYNKQLILEKENELQKEQSEKALLSQKNAENQLKIQRSRSIFIVIISAVLLITIVIIWIINRRRLEKEKQFSKDLAFEKEIGLQKTLAAQEEERKRIAKDLHDGIVQDIVAIKLNLNSEGTVNKTDLIGKLDKTAAEIRELSHQMMPYALKELGLIDAIEDLCNKLLPAANINYEIEVVGDLKNRFPEIIEITIYRVLQELLNNLIKHSGASQMNITFTLRNKFFTIIMEDNGKGFETNKKSSGIGISNMKSRISSLNGEMKIESEIGQGTMFIIKIPI